MLQQIVLHPTVTAYLKVQSTTVAKDKTLRSVQYLARFLAFYFSRKGYSQDTVNRLAALKSSLGLSRKREAFPPPFPLFSLGTAGPTDHGPPSCAHSDANR